MGINSIIALLGGLGAFLFGMKYMGEGLELAAGPKMKELLEKLTRNRIMGFLLGALVTVVIQSSSATTVMVMGFINAEIMDLAQATGVIFGANIGTDHHKYPDRAGRIRHRTDLYLYRCSDAFVCQEKA